MNLKFEVAKFYSTRSKHKVLLHEVNEGELKGVLRLENGEWVKCEWRASGNFDCSDDSPLSLVGEWVEPQPKHPAEDWVSGQKIMVRDWDDERWNKLYFSHLQDGVVYTFSFCTTEWVEENDTPFTVTGQPSYRSGWNQARLPTEEELKAGGG